MTGPTESWARRAIEPKMERAHGVGKLVVGRRGDLTVVRDCYQEAAIRIRMPKPGPGMPFEAVLLNTSGGLTGGDRLSVSIEAAADTRLAVTTQAAEKIYRASGGIAKVETRLTLHTGASLDWLPQEAILFDGASLERRLDIDMAEDASLVAVETIMFGRLARGEVVDNAHLFDRWRLRRGGRLVYAEGLKLSGHVAKKLSRAAAGGTARAISTMVMAAPDAEARLDEARALLDQEMFANVEAGVSAFDGLLTMRALSADPFLLRRALTLFLTAMRGPLPRVWAT
ncbi:MAG: urease accessory protein UreD [Alphaproteobacteria bacterium]